MMAELAQTSRLVGEIDSALAGVKGLEAARARGAARRAADAGAADPWVSRRDSVMGRVDAIKRLLAQSRSRVAELQRQNRAMDRSADDFRATIAQLEATVERQQRELAALSATADSLRTVGQQYAVERDATRDTLTSTRDAANSVYYVVGRRRELLEKHVVTEEAPSASSSPAGAPTSCRRAGSIRARCRASSRRPTSAATWSSRSPSPTSRTAWCRGTTRRCSFPASAPTARPTARCTWPSRSDSGRRRGISSSCRIERVLRTA
jgi:hypothetical protein